MVSVDTKKKELAGDFKNGGSDHRPKGDPRRVKAHDAEMASIPTKKVSTATKAPVCGASM